MITEVVLKGFKGIDATYELGKLNALHGPNGAGKSALLEAIRFALLAETPAGKTNDAAALFFGVGGGYVELHNDKGQWIHRGIKVTRTRGGLKISEVLDASTCTTVPDEPYLAPWRADAEVLVLSKLTALSAEKKREFLLKLCGGADTADAGEVFACVKKHYARLVAGSAATEETVDHPQDLPEDERDLMDEWTRDRGVADVVDMHIEQEQTLSSIMMTLAKVAQESKNHYRKAASQAKEAMADHEQAAKGVEGAAAEIEQRHLEVAKARDALQTAKEQQARHEEAALAANRSNDALVTAAAAKVDADAAARGIPAPGDQPEAPVEPPRRREIQDRLDAIRHEDGEAHYAIEQIEARVQRHGEILEGIYASNDALERHKELAVHELFVILKKLDPDAFAELPRALGLVTTLHSTWDTQREKLLGRQATLLKQLEEVKATAEGDEEQQVALSKAIADRATERDLLEDELHEVERTWECLTTSYTSTWQAWVSRQQAYDQAQNNLSGAERALEALSANHKQASERLAETPAPEHLAELERILYAAEAALSKAEEAVGALHTYEDASERAQQHTLSHEAWKVAERAIKKAREYLLGDATAPLLQDVNAFLEAAGMEERVYLELESERGKRIFNLGWARNGTRVSLEALSGGQAALLGAALSMAIAARVARNRIVMIEADPLDAEHLRRMLAGLAAQADCVESIIVATYKPIPIEATEWRVIPVGMELTGV